MNTLSFDEFMERAAYHDLLDNAKRARGCPETINGEHGEPTADGRCTYCKGYITHRAARPLPPRHPGKPADVLAYDYFYNPDYGTDRRDIY